MSKISDSRKPLDIVHCFSTDPHCPYGQRGLRAAAVSALLGDMFLKQRILTQEGYCLLQPTNYQSQNTALLTQEPWQECIQIIDHGHFLWSTISSVLAHIWSQLYSIPLRVWLSLRWTYLKRKLILDSTNNSSSMLELVRTLKHKSS